MPLYDRLLGRDDASQPVTAKIQVHQFQALFAEVGRGNLTGAQANAAIAQMTGVPLDPTGVTEASTLLATVTSLGTLQAKLNRVDEIDDVLLLAELNINGYGLPAQVKTRLGV